MNLLVGDKRSIAALSVRNIAVPLLSFGMTVGAPCALVVATPHDMVAQQRSSNESSQENPRWAPIRQVFGQGEAEGHYFRVNLPRTDLHVRIGADTLEPGLELTSYVGFMPAGTAASDVMAMGEVVVREDEVPAALAEARKQGVSVTALHNHLLSESPHVMYMHVMAEGSAKAIATKMHAVFASTATPLEPQHEHESQATNAADWSVIDGILGKHSEAEGRTAEYEFPRHERLSVHGKSVESVGTLETAFEVVFQRLGPGRALRPESFTCSRARSSRCCEHSTSTGCTRRRCTITCSTTDRLTTGCTGTRRATTRRLPRPSRRRSRS